MKDYVFNKPLPFVTPETEASKSKTTKYLARGMSKVFLNDQRNVVYFAFGLGIPTIIMCLFCMLYIAGSNILLQVFNIILICFLGWVVSSMIDIYHRYNEVAAKYDKETRELDECK